MRKLAKYLKPYIGPIIACVVLLFGQAMCDLNLPNMMSNIVNVGIQQGGIEDPAPKAIGADGFSFLQQFMDETARLQMEQSYHLVAVDSAEAAAYLDSYPALQNTDIYVQNTLDDPELEATADAYSRGVATIANAMKAVAGEQTRSGEYRSSSALLGRSDV